MDDERGFIWDVYPDASNKTMVATGQVASEDKAYRLVEFVMAAAPDAGWGMVIGPDGRTRVCRRGNGKFVWRPLWPELDPGAVK